jgi:hypothetical protein
MALVAHRTVVDFPEDAYQLLDPSNVNYWISRLREGEASVRKIRNV